MLKELGIQIGHWTDETARTGCTVLLFPEGTTASAEVRGGAPACRELEVLAPERLVSHVDAALLTGGSAFGLAAADGVMRWCEERGLGVSTPAGPVPIVPTLGLFDLAVGDASVRPGPDQGYAACEAAGWDLTGGRLGAGTGAMTGAVRGRDRARPGGLGVAAMRAENLTVFAAVAVNSFGVVDVDGGELASMVALARPKGVGDPSLFTNTVIGVVATNARLDKLGCLIAAQGAHDGLARAVAPPHSRVDGDAFIAAATGKVEADVDAVRLLAMSAVDRAIRSAGTTRPR